MVTCFCSSDMIVVLEFQIVACKGLLVYSLQVTQELIQYTHTLNVYIYIHVHVHAHTYTHTYTLTHTHTHTHTRLVYAGSHLLFQDRCSSGSSGHSRGTASCHHYLPSTRSVVGSQCSCYCLPLPLIDIL